MQNEIIKLCHLEHVFDNFPKRRILKLLILKSSEKKTDMHQFHAMTVEICLRPLSKVITSYSGAASGKLMTNPPGPQVLDKQTESVPKPR